MIGRLKHWWTTPQPYDAVRLGLVLLAWIWLVVASLGLVILTWNEPPATRPGRMGPP